MQLRVIIYLLPWHHGLLTDVILGPRIPGQRSPNIEDFAAVPTSGPQLILQQHLLQSGCRPRQSLGAEIHASIPVASAGPNPKADVAVLKDVRFSLPTF